MGIPKGTLFSFQVIIYGGNKNNCDEAKLNSFAKAGEQTPAFVFYPTLVL
jgi:hypothetical protein